MSSRYSAILALNDGFPFLNLESGHVPDLAKKFLNTIGHKRHVYSHEKTSEDHINEKEILIYSNSSGLLLYNNDLAMEFALGGVKIEKAASVYKTLLGVSYNDQCLVDVMSYYENGNLIRQICEIDGLEGEEIKTIGELLPEEIDFLKTDNSYSDLPIEDLYSFNVDGTTYYAESKIPMLGAGVALFERLLGLDPWLVNIPCLSVFKPKPWWQRW